MRCLYYDLLPKYSNYIKCLGSARNSEEFLAGVVDVGRLPLRRDQAPDVGLAARLGALVLAVDRVALAVTRAGVPAVAVPAALLGLGRAGRHRPRPAGVPARSQPRRDDGPVDVGHVVVRGHGGRVLEAAVAPVVLAGEQVAEALTDHWSPPGASCVGTPNILSHYL